MNLSPGTVLVIIVVVAVANILVALAVVARSRAQRARQFAEVDALLASSTRDERHWDDSPAPADTWLPSAEQWPTAQQQLSLASDGWPAAGALGAAGARRADPADVLMAPFEFAAPARPVTEPTDDDPEDDDPEDDDPEDDDPLFEDEDMNGTELQLDAPDDDEATADELEAEEGESTEPEIVAAAASTHPGPTYGRDVLTGLLDATAFDEAMSHEEAREQRYGHPATVIVFELDGLGKLVDRLGPEPGDRIETALSDTIKRLARRADYVARLERGRYAALLPETDEVAAINYVERIRRACDLWLESGAIAMRLAIGWASTTGDAGLSGAVRVATDRMRVELRRNGRGVGDETAGVDELDVAQPAEAASGI